MAKSLFKAVVLVAAFSIITRVLGFLFRIYLSRELGPEMLGVYQIASSVFMVLVLLVASGIPLTVSKKTARTFVKKDSKSAHSIVTGALFISLVVAFIICFVFIVFQNVIAKIFTDSACMEVLLIFLPAVIFSAIYSSLRGYLWGEQDYFSMGLSELIEQIARILLFIILSKCLIDSMNGAKIGALSLTVACFVSMLFVLFVYIKKGGKLKKPKGQIKSILKSSAPITGVRAASSLIQPIIAIIFPAMLVVGGVEKGVAVSIYGVVMGMTFPLLFLPSTLIGSLSFALIPELAKAQERKDYGLVEERIKSGLLFAVLISSIIVPLYIGLGVPMCEFLFDNSLSGEFLKYASVIMIPMGLSNISSSILNSLNLEVKSFVNNIVGGVILVLCVVCFSQLIGAYALILGFGLCMLATSTLNIIMIKRCTHISLHIIKPLILSLLFCVPTTVLVKNINNVLSLFVPSFISMCFSGLVGVCCFAMLLWVFKVCDFMFVFSRVKNVIKFSKKRA